MLALSHILRNNFSWIKPVVFCPFSLFEKIISRKQPFNLLCKYLNEHSKNLFEKIVEKIPKDENEKFLKFFPLLKKEKKFLEVFKRKIILVTNKKIIEIEDEEENLENLAIFPIAKFELINVNPQKNEVEIIYSHAKKIEYSSISFMSLCKLIKDIYNKDCLIPLTIKKKN